MQIIPQTLSIALTIQFRKAIQQHASKLVLVSKKKASHADHNENWIENEKPFNLCTHCMLPREKNLSSSVNFDKI